MRFRYSNATACKSWQGKGRDVVNVLCAAASARLIRPPPFGPPDTHPRRAAAARRLCCVARAGHASNGHGAADHIRQALAKHVRHGLALAVEVVLEDTALIGVAHHRVGRIAVHKPDVWRREGEEKSWSAGITYSSRKKSACLRDEQRHAPFNGRKHPPSACQRQGEQPARQLRLQKGCMHPPPGGENEGGKKEQDRLLSMRAGGGAGRGGWQGGIGAYIVVAAGGQTARRVLSYWQTRHHRVPRWKWPTRRHRMLRR